MQYNTRLNTNHGLFQHATSAGNTPMSVRTTAILTQDTELQCERMSPPGVKAVFIQSSPDARVSFFFCYFKMICIYYHLVR